MERKTASIQNGRGDLFLLTLATFINPTATTDEIAAFIAFNGGEVYERQTIDKRFRCGG